jgi:hypothetical protein
MPIHEEKEDRPGPDAHPRQHALEGFMRDGGIPCEEVRAIVRHLLTECPECLATTRRLWWLRNPTRALRSVTEGEQTLETSGINGRHCKAGVL